MRRGHALPLVVLVLGLLSVAITAFALAVRGSIDNARTLAAQARAEAAGRGLAAAVELALAEAVAAGATVMASPGHHGTAWDLVRVEGGNSCVPAAATSLAQLAVAPATPAVVERGCFSGWLPASLAADEVRLVRLGVAAGASPRGAGFFPTTPVTSSAVLLSFTVRDANKDARATTRTVVQALSTSPFALQGLSRLPARLPSLALSGVVHGDGDVCLGAADVARLTSGGTAGCSGDSATVGGVAVAASAADWPAAHGRRLLDARHGVRAVRGPFSSLQQVLAPPQPGESSTARRARVAAQAGVRIVDGTWFARPTSPSTAWPGRVLWSDHPGDLQTAGDEEALLHGAINVGRAAFGEPPAHLYSRYESTGSGGIDAGRDGVVFYGATTRDGDRHVPAAPSSSGVRTAASDADLVAGARLLIVDGTTGRVELPINIDVAALGRAVTSNAAHELGTDGAWNGVLWISSSWPGRRAGAPRPAAGGNVDAAQPAADAGGQQAVPDALCSQTRAGDVIAGLFVTPLCRGDGPRPTVVRLLNGRNLQAFAPTGLVVATDLPLVVVGDWNTATLSGTAVPSALLADRVVQVGDGFTDDDALAVAGATGVVARSATLRLRAHVLAGVAPDAGVARFADVIGVVEVPASLDHEGARVIAFASTTRATPLPPAARPSALSWTPWSTAAPTSLSVGVVVDLSSTRVP